MDAGSINGIKYGNLRYHSTDRAVFVSSVRFCAFPSLLLVITLYRLSINVASTKLILGLGADFDGEVVIAFASSLPVETLSWELLRLPSLPSFSLWL